MLQEVQADVTRPILSQSSDSTSRLGRSAEGTDAQSRPGAGCKPARRHRTRSASESALAKASLGERDSLNRVAEIRTNVKIRSPSMGDDIGQCINVPTMPMTPTTTAATAAQKVY
jgi:hypothetical protein